MSLPMDAHPDIVKSPGPQTGKEAGGEERVPVPRFLSSERGGRWRVRAWGSEEGVVRPVALAALGQRYRRYRLADPPAEEAMAGSLRRWGQLAPVVACRRGDELELLDGFKRWTAARQGSRADDAERACAGSGRADGEGGDPGTEPRSRRRARVGGSVDRASVGACDGLTQVEAAHLWPAQELGVPPAGAPGEAE